MCLHTYQLPPNEVAARDHVRKLLREIMADELAHVGQRRNFLGPIGVRVARWMVGPMHRVFFRDIPEARLLFDVGQMVESGLYVAYAPQHLLKGRWHLPERPARLMAEGVEVRGFGFVDRAHTDSSGTRDRGGSALGVRPEHGRD